MDSAFWTSLMVNPSSGGFQLLGAEVKMCKGSSALELMPFPMPAGWVEEVSKLGDDLKLCGAKTHRCWDMHLYLLCQCITETYAVIAMKVLVPVRVFTSPFDNPPHCLQFPSKDWKDDTGTDFVSTCSTWPSAEMKMKDLLFQNHRALYLS